MKRKNTYKRALEGHPKAVRKLTRLGVPLGAAASSLAEYLRLNLEDEDASDEIRERMDSLWNRLTGPEQDIARIFKGQADQIAELRRKLAAGVVAEPKGVLGPWRPEAPDGNYARRPVAGSLSMCVWKNGWGAGIVSSDLAAQGPETGGAGQDAADEWARAHGYVLLDAPMGSHTGELLPWWESGQGMTRLSRGQTPAYVVTQSSRSWHISTTRDRPLAWGRPILAWGPQTGEEGRRFADAAAYALGLTDAPPGAKAIWPEDEAAAAENDVAKMDNEAVRLATVAE